MKKTISLFILLLPAGITYIRAQDPHFSQFFEAPLLRNPSLAGIFDGDVRIQGVYRTQWGSVTVPYQTGSLAAEVKKPIGSNNDFITMGMQLLYDRAGTVNLATTYVMPAVNYHKALRDDKTKYLSLGIMGGLVQRSFDRSKVTTNNQYDGFGYNPSLSDGELFANNRYSYADGSIGLSFNSSIAERVQDNYYLGIAYHHLNRPKNSFYKNPEVELNAKWELSGGVKLTAGETSFVTVYANYTRQGSYNETLVGALYGYKIGDDPEEPQYTVQFGAVIRAKDAIIPVVKLDYKPFSLVCSYDANLSRLKTSGTVANAFEISLSYAAFSDRYNSSKNAVACPRF
ncbi:PorP/SprF family type IX secretion system membrane protein [Filimonas effusa]|uniref:Type IX secretion system membrane protein PorP/SprF n=1 Tax=Filimonas effusa TaxID=2508721 RepID=A0A4Q1DB80_9BACT|nr:PorP/SprF family type IX secretion system membrane protein [Filimonas effusa]RXK86550.1 type IX secretion system membrane protein PorP/SprF [Filimonas effusa]